MPNVTHQQLDADTVRVKLSPVVFNPKKFVPAAATAAGWMPSANNKNNAFEEPARVYKHVEESQKTERTWTLETKDPIKLDVGRHAQ